MRLHRMLITLVLWPAFAFAETPAPGPDPGPAPTQPALRTELLEMQAADQAVRARAPTTEAETKTMMDVDLRHTARLKEIIAAHGWPSKRLVGEDGAGAAWLLAQHADADPDFQRSVLALLEPLVESGEVKAANVAYLWDRTHAPQRYGTQGACNAEGGWSPREIEAADGVDARRADVGLPPMAEYVELVSTYCASAP